MLKPSTRFAQSVCGGGFATLSLLCVTACGARTGDDTTSAAGGGPSVSAGSLQTKEQFLSAIVDGYCQLLECYEASFLLPLEDCPAAFERSYGSRPEWHLPSLHYDAERAAQCVNLIATVSCDDVISNNLPLDDACNAVFAGDKANGEACLYRECQPGLFCDDASSCPGVCRPLPGQGQACLSDCALGHTCIGSIGDIEDPRHCEADGTQGMECGSAVRECGPGLVCDESASPPSCRPYFDVFAPAALGAACETGTQCDVGAFCSSSTVQGVCTKRIAEGDPCPGLLDCERGLYCDPTQRVCVKPLPLGSACTQQHGCVGGVCIDGTCQVQRELGSPCVDHGACASYHCAEGVCALNPVCDIP